MVCFEFLYSLRARSTEVTLTFRTPSFKLTGVPRILENSLPEHLERASSSSSPVQQSMKEGGDDDWAPYAEYMKTTRINVNVRQVFPKGFDPALEPVQAESEGHV